MFGKPNIDFVDGDLCVISSGNPTEPTVSKTPTHLVAGYDQTHIPGDDLISYLIEKVWSSETALNFPREVGEVQWASSACNFPISGGVSHPRKPLNPNIRNEPAGSFDLPSFWYATKMSAK